MKPQPGCMRSEKGDTVSGMFAAQTPDAVAKVKEFYDSKLKELGYKTETSDVNTGTGTMSTVTVQKDDKQKEISVLINQNSGEPTNITIQYSGSKN
jgi:hypothetical protein